MEEKGKVHWADSIAKELIESEPKKECFVVAAGITPSGVVHIGNFRDMITVELVARAVKDAGKKARFIYSWDDYDVFRKVPSNVPGQEVLQKYLRYPIDEVPDPFGKEKSYALHNELAVERELPKLGIFPEFIPQAEKYRNCEYSGELRTAMRERKTIREILDRYRKEPHPDDWFPAKIFCEKCRKDDTKITSYDEEYAVSYECACGFKSTFDIRKKGIIKLVWRVDWPMRWHYEKVDFEPSGKEHSSEGGSVTTAQRIVKAVWKRLPPKCIMYEFIGAKGTRGKMSSSKGNTIDLKEMLSIYPPEIIRNLFVKTVPRKYFEVSFEGMDVIRHYDEFQRLERIYFGKEECPKEDLELNKRFYELSCVSVPKKMPPQASFRALIPLVQVCEGDGKEIAKHFPGTDEKYLSEMVARVVYWLNNYAEDRFKFTVQENVGSGVVSKLGDKQKLALKELAKKLNSQNEREIIVLCDSIMKNNSLSPKEFFEAAYLVLINKTRGPKLAGFILAVGLDKAKRLFLQA